MHWNGLNSDVKHLLKHIFRGGGLVCQKYNSQINENFEKWQKISNKNLIAGVKMLHIRVINKYIINLEIGGGGYPVVVNYQTLLSSLFSIASPPIIFLYKL